MMISNEKKSRNSLHFVTDGQFLFYKKCYIFQERISQIETVEISLTSTGCDLRQMLAEKLGLPAHHLKMICRGQVVSMTKSLQEQNVKVWIKTVVSISTVVCAVKFITYSLTWFGCNVLLMIYLCHLSYRQHGSQLMGLCLSVSEAEAAQKEEEVMEMMNTRQAAELLSSKVEKGQLQLERKNKVVEFKLNSQIRNR